MVEGPQLKISDLEIAHAYMLAKVFKLHGTATVCPAWYRYCLYIVLGTRVFGFVFGLVGN